jgi:hypothetical protein
MLNETKFFNELEKIKDVVSRVTVEKDGTLVVSKQIDTAKERYNIAQQFKKLNKDLDGDKKNE